MAAKKTKTVNKTKYVKSLPATMPAKEVVEKAKADGLTLTTNYVYTIRNKASKGSKGSKSSASSASTASSASSNGASSVVVAKKRGRPAGSVNKVKKAMSHAAAPSSSSTAHVASAGSTRNHEGELYRLIERIVESKVREVLTARFGALLK